MSKFCIEVHNNPSKYEFDGSVSEAIETMDALHRYLLDGHDPRVAHTKLKDVLNCHHLKRSNRNHVSTKIGKSDGEEVQRSSFDITLKQIKDNATG